MIIIWYLASWNTFNSVSCISILFSVIIVQKCDLTTNKLHTLKDCATLTEITKIWLRALSKWDVTLITGIQIVLDDLTGVSFLSRTCANWEEPFSCHDHVVTRCFFFFFQLRGRRNGTCSVPDCTELNCCLSLEANLTKLEFQISNC